ncbi:MAG: glycoside hydrolase family 6 protein [Polyangiaceae bacterium]
MNERVLVWAALAQCLGLLVGCSDASSNPGAEPGAAVESALSTARFYTPPPRTEALAQIAGLLREHRPADASRLKAMLAVPHATWLVGGTPAEVKKQVRKTVDAANCERALPIFVAYNIPFRDCSAYSAGGALDSSAYAEWIEGVAKGIGRAKALVVLEPDGLGIIPNNTTIYGVQEWCKVSQTDENGNVIYDDAGNPVPLPGANPSERYAQLKAALATLQSLAPNAQVYLDATHSGWLGVGDAAYRLVQAGVQNAKGFFLNTSNYELTENNVTFGGWVSSCIAAGTLGPDWAQGHFDWCPSQYNPALGYQLDYSPEYAASVDSGLAGLMGDAVASIPFVIDTSRNGQGPWTPSASYPDAQSWCNPPHRGVGLRTTAATGNPLVDAYLWVKVPGESDGSCTRGIADATIDPEWGIVDPAAGAWFPEQALELAQLANPPLSRR